MGRIAVVIYMTKVSKDKLYYTRKTEELMSSLGEVDGVINYDISNIDEEIERRNYLKTLDEIKKFKEKELVIVVPSSIQLSNDPVVVQQISYYLDKIMSNGSIEVWFARNTNIGGIEFDKSLNN
nr:hypothetical protein [uncultured Anaerosporobacter sp.]